MPFINTITNVKLTDENKLALKSEFGKAIEIFGKSENWLMLAFNDNYDMYFNGETAPMAFVDVSIFGQPADAQCEEMTKAMCRIFEKELGISPDKLYVKYNGSTQWGWNNMNF